MFAPNLAELNCFKQAAANLNRLGRMARATVAELAAERDERTSQYRADLTAFDWHFEMADDSAIWRAGGLQLLALREMQAELDHDGAIWRSIAPVGFAVPMPVVGSAS